ncbi:MAG: beta-methylgalactoside transporter [Ruminococcaceae bacterium]|nr:beta-methylgalactoside transporter [Oscillospiraceae bacterium]
MKLLKGKKKDNDGLVTVVDKRSTPKKILDFVINNALYFMIAILVIVVAIQYPLFLKNAPLDLLKRTAAYVIMALGVGGIIVLTGTDLSAGRIMGLTSLVAASLLQKMDAPNRVFPEMEAWPIIVVILLVIVIGAVIGAFNGFFVAKFDLHPFIVTLSTQLMLYGFMLIYLGFGTNKGQNIAHLTDAYKGLITNTVKIGSWSIPNFVWLSIIMIGVMWFIWNKTTLGKNMYAVGSNPEAAKVSGVNVLGTIVSIFTMAGVLYSINGFVEAARVGGPGASAGSNAELDAIAACVIGGVSFVGGIGKISGIVIGVILLQLISVALQWMSVSANLVYIIKGAIILFAVTLDMRKYIAKK